MYLASIIMIITKVTISSMLHGQLHHMRWIGWPGREQPVLELVGFLGPLEREYLGTRQTNNFKNNIGT